MIISGVIKDATGDALMGASVSAETMKMTVGTTSDFDGKFYLDLKDQILTTPIKISYLGYKSKAFNPSDLKNKTVVLEDDIESLDEIVIVGNKTKPKTTKSYQLNKIIGYGSLFAGVVAIAIILVKQKR